MSRSGGVGGVDGLPGAEPLRQCLREVEAEVEPSAWRAFVEFVQEGRPAREVAACNGMTENAVFLAKRRVLRRLREVRPAIERAFG